MLPLERVEDPLSEISSGAFMTIRDSSLQVDMTTCEACCIRDAKVSDSSIRCATKPQIEFVEKNERTHLKVVERIVAIHRLNTSNVVFQLMRHRWR